MQSIKTLTEVIQYESKDNRMLATTTTMPGVAAAMMTSTSSKDIRDEFKERSSGIPTELPDDDPDLIPNKLLEQRPDIFEPNYAASGANRTKEFGCLEELDFPSPSSVLHAKDSWIYPNGYVERGGSERSLSPARPSTLPVHRTHDIYTRSLRVQESCI